MGKHILFALLSGLLVLGMSSAFAEEPQLSDQEILKAWGQAQQEDVQQISEVTGFKGNQGPQVLTDEDLDQVNAAGLIITNYSTHFAIIQPDILIGGIKNVNTACANSCGGPVYYGVIVDK